MTVPLLHCVVGLLSIVGVYYTGARKPATKSAPPNGSFLPKAKPRLPVWKAYRDLGKKSRRD